MKVLITGSQGFIAKNLIEKLNKLNNIDIITFSSKNSLKDLMSKMDGVDFIYHLAGINRPQNNQEFYFGNHELTKNLTKAALESKTPIPILMTSSIQVNSDNDYGKSKLKAESELSSYNKKSNAKVNIYRLPNVFGKWSKPNYNSVIATWCYNISRGIPIKINDKSNRLQLVYIDDVIDQFISHLDESKTGKLLQAGISPVYSKTLKEINDLINSFKTSRKNLIVNRVGNGFERALYATYLSFLPTDKFSYKLSGHQDERGAFYEFIKTLDSGQVSISTTAPGVTRGNHYHNTKNEKFLVIKGTASIKLRQIFGNDIIEYKVSDKKMEVVEMIPGYTHDITNIGDEEMVLLLWANETFDKEKPDTYFLKV